ncbi:MAG: peptide deformylase [Mailhella sp.]|nr:peptide deformylase [Mailhella sp.]
MLRPVVQYPDPLLAKVCEPVAEIDDGVRALAQDLLDTLNTVGGVGIAAPQIGVLRRVVVIDVSPELNDPEAPQDFRVFINPVVTVLDARPHEENEGCLSVPELRAKVKRPRRVALDALDLEGRPVHIEGEGYYGACMQHETDHLDGKLFIDYISYLKRSLYDKKMRRGRR